MSLENYERHIIQKYQLAAAIAVLKNKPENISIEEHIQNIRQKFRSEKMDDDDFCDDVICIDDFEFDDEEIEEVIGGEDSMNILNDFVDIHNTDGSELVINNLTKVNDVENFVNTKDREISDTSYDSKERSDENSLIDVLNTLREIDQTTTVDKAYISNTQSTYCHDSQYIPGPVQINSSEATMTIDTNFDAKNIQVYDITQNDDGSEMRTVDETMIAKVANNVNKHIRKQYENHDNTVVQHTATKFNDDLENSVISTKADQSIHLQTDIEMSDDVFDKQDTLHMAFIREKAAKVAKNVRKDMEDHRRKSTEFNQLNVQFTADNTQTNVHDSQATIPYTLHGFTENTQISQSQTQNMEIHNKFILGNKDRINPNRKSTSDTAENQYPINIQQANVTNQNSQPNTLITIDSGQIQYITDYTGKTYAVLHTINIGSNESNTNNKILRHTQENSQKDPGNSKEFESFQTNISLTFDTEIKSTNSEINYQKNTKIDDEVYSNDNEPSQSEAVPFKVIKELTKVKAFLKKRDRRCSTEEFSADSGYRSDSQHSFKSAHVSDNWVHQSAYCLYSYITQCPLVVNTQDIVTDIAQVLGRLIDRLHDDEKYPPFIEELLEKIDNLIQELYNGGDCDDILLEKDKTIQRILLLNNSKHTLSFTIDKIIIILEKMHAELTGETLYELTNILQVENLCYIFFVLEILIKKLNSAKSASEDDPPSQKKVLKKSSITDIWKKKWNSNFKEVVTEGSQKICVLTKCSDILNKIVVECMEGYSLVAYAALQCFNLLQN